MSDESDLSADQTDKLAYFQEITHIESIDECKQILEAFQWNIETAVQNTFNEPDIQRNRSNSSSSSSLPSAASTSTAASATASSHSLLPSASSATATTAEEFINGLRNQYGPINVPAAFPAFGMGELTRQHQRLERQPLLSADQQLPAVNTSTLRALSYFSPRATQTIPRGFFQWSVFLITFPFKIVFATILDIASYFSSYFDSQALPIDYDPLANVTEYVISYNEKYGTNHPEFFAGSYSQAVSEAKKSLKFLLVYVHQNDNKDCTTFATETFNDSNLIEFINGSFICWSCSKNLSEGNKVFNALKGRRAPFLGVIVLKHARMTLVSKIEGPISAGELIVQLARLVAENEAELVAVRHDREQLSQNQLIRQQQDEAYLESLKVDQAKARKQQELMDEQRRAQEAEQQLLEEEKAKENAILTRKEELRKLIAETPQPDASNSQALKLVVKLPTGSRLERVFLKTAPLSDLYKFVFSNEECPLSFEIVTNFPRKLIECNEETTTSIQEFGINQSMLLFVNDLDA